MNRRAFLRTAAAGTGFAWLGPRTAFAQDYPSRIVRIVASNSAGTPPDILARVAAAALSDGEGWKVIVENKPGGIGTIAANEVLRQEADGHTVFSIAGPITAAPALLPNASFSLETDFAPVIHFATGYNVLVVNPKLPVHSVSELIDFLKQNPDKHTFSSGGYGTPAHLLGEAFKLETGVKTTHVPYNQFSRAIADLLSGVNSYQLITMLPVVQHIQSGALRALAVMSNKRVAALEAVPTIAEAGLPKLAAEDWGGFVVKSGTPSAVIARLNAAVNKALKAEKVRESFAKMGVDVGGGTPEEFGARIRAETVRWAKVIKDAGIKINS
jgi:tripartite-type tricarboxylate transporter receptor subunit TctC